MQKGQPDYTNRHERRRRSVSEKLWVPVVFGLCVVVYNLGYTRGKLSSFFPVKSNSFDNNIIYEVHATTSRDDTSNTTVGAVEESVDWCSKIDSERKELHPDLHISYPCEPESLPSTSRQTYKSAIVTFLTAGVEEGKGSRTVFTCKDYINGALALGATLATHLTRDDTLRLILVSEGFILPEEEKAQLEGVGWIVGKAPNVQIESTFVPRFARYKTTYTKISALGLSEFDCILLMDADTLVVDNIDDLLSCDVFNNDDSVGAEYHVAGTLDYYHRKWYHFNTGSILWNTNVNEMNRVYNLTKDESFMRRFESDQIFLNTVYDDRTNVSNNLLLLEEGPNDSTNKDLWGRVVNLGWAYNAQTHVEVQLPEFWNSHSKGLKIIHYTEKKGWQCPERHNEVYSEEERNDWNCADNNRELRNELCFCSVGSLWWDALRKGEQMVTDVR